MMLGSIEEYGDTASAGELPLALARSAGPDVGATMRFARRLPLTLVDPRSETKGFFDRIDVKLFSLAGHLIRVVTPALRGSMGSLRLILSMLSVLVAVLSWLPNSYGQRLYSYTDENGIRVFTDTPPKIAYPDLTTLGTSPAPSARDQAPIGESSTAYDFIIQRYAAQYNIDPRLIRSMIETESRFNPKAVSSKGALGLMQLMPDTAARIGVDNPFDPDQNIRGGAQHMRNLLDTFENDLILSLAAYNAGENLVQRIGRIPNYRETHQYITAVTNKYGQKSMAPQPEPLPPKPVVFRFVDEQGVLHLTNIPPVRRTEPVITPIPSRHTP